MTLLFVTSITARRAGRKNSMDRQARREANKRAWKWTDGLCRQAGAKPNKANAERLGFNMPDNVKKINW